MTGFFFDATYGDPLQLQRRRIFRYDDKQLMENRTLGNGLLENLDVTFEEDQNLDVIVEYTFRNNKRPLDEMARPWQPAARQKVRLQGEQLAVLERSWKASSQAQQQRSCSRWRSEL